MRRLILSSALAIACCASLTAQEGKKDSPHKPPQWQRTLNGENRKKSEELEKTVEAFEKEDRYPEAIELQEELLALRSKLQGAEHWETVLEREKLQTLRKVSALDADGRAGWRKSVETADKANELEAKGDHAGAFPLIEERLKWARRVLGEDHSTTALNYARLGANLNARSKYAEAHPHYEKSLAICRKTLGEDHPYVGHAYNNIGFNWNAQGKYLQSLPILQKALDCYRRVYGEEHASTANGYLNLGQNLQAQSKFADAGIAFQKALEIRRKVHGEKHTETILAYAYTASNLAADNKNAQAQPLFEKTLELVLEVVGDAHHFTATSFHNVANNLDVLERYQQAQPMHERSLAIYRRLYGEEDLNTAIGYESVGLNLLAQKKHPDAQPHLQKTLDIRLKLLQGPDELTADAYNNLATNLDHQKKFADAQPLHEKALAIYQKTKGSEHARSALSHNNLAINLKDQRKRADAQPHFEKALAIRRRVLGENDILTAESYTEAGGNLNALSKFAEAEKHLQKALDIRIRLHGEDHPKTAAAYANLGANYYEQQKHAAAETLIQKSLDIRLRLFKEMHPETADSYQMLAANRSSQGNHSAANPLLLKALEIRRRVFDEAHEDTAASYDQLGVNLTYQGQFEQGLSLMAKALKIRIQLFGESDPAVARCYNHIAANLAANDRHQEARAPFQKALDIYRKAFGEEHADTARGLNDSGYNLTRLGEFAEARRRLEKALELRVRLLGEDHPDTAVTQNNLAINYDAQGKNSESQPLLEKAHQTARRIYGQGHPNLNNSLYNLAACLTAQGKRAEAEEFLRTAAPVFEANRAVSAEGIDRASVSRPNPRKLLACLLTERDPYSAWREVEWSLARGSLDEEASRRFLRPTPKEIADEKSWQDEIAPIQARILNLATRARSAEEEKELDELTAKRQALEERLIGLKSALSQRQIADSDSIQKSLAPDSALIFWLDVADLGGSVEEHWACVVRRDGAPKWEKLPGAGGKRKWAEVDIELASEYRKALVSGKPAAECEALAQSLRKQRIQPALKSLEGVKTLYVVAVQEMAGIPVELLAPEFTVGYVPSGTFLARRPKGSPNSPSLLAMGDPIYELDRLKDGHPLPKGGLLIQQIDSQGNAAKSGLALNDVILKYGDDFVNSVEDLTAAIERGARSKAEITLTLWRIDAKNQPAEFTRKAQSGPLGASLSKEPAPQAIANRRKNDEAIAKLRGEWRDLPGTRYEVGRISKLFERKDVFLDSNASERTIEKLRQSGELAKFRYLHFATHGIGNVARSFDSVILLAQDLPAETAAKDKAPLIDNRISAREVLDHWKIDCDLVTLSACETALGKSGGGDGLLGFAQAFLLAGSRSVCLSLWKVDDTATALLMGRFYENLLGKRDGIKPMPKLGALKEAKEWLRNLSNADALRLGADLRNGVVRSERKKTVDLPPPPAKDEKPYADPRFWAAFILIGDPD